jgi:3-hydroxyisobutyrate dehydrogenase-like beta-hydroxyacid dehydrogenase
LKIGFVGLGLMGVPMARNMRRAGHELVVYSANRSACEELAREGARVATSIAEAVAAVDLFCACRVTPEHSRELFLGPRGVLATGRAGLLCIDFATIDPATTKAIGAALGARGIGFLDVPISGGPYAAVEAGLTAIVGGSEDDVARAMPALRSTCKEVRHMGPIGAGVTTKLCNNLISITTHALLAEAMVLGAKAGIDSRKLYETLRASSARSNSLERVVPYHFLPRDFTAAASIVTVIKDLGCAIELGEALGVELSLGHAAMARLREALDQGHADKDIAAVILPIEAKAGVTVGAA